MIRFSGIESIAKRLRDGGWIGLAIVLLALLFRTVLLDIKPAHFDEGVNGWFVDQLQSTGLFRYDPENYHGPLHFYVLFISQTLFGRNLWALRLPIVLVSVASVWMALKYDRFVGRRTARLAALALAVSPGMVFYGRYSIHESWLVLFLILLFWGLAGLWRFGRRRYLWATATALVGMVMTKETYLIHWICALLALGCLWLYARAAPAAEFPYRQQRTWNRIDVWRVAACGVALIVFFFSGNLHDFSLLKGLYQTYALWIATGSEGHGHEKEWYYWFKLFWRYEWVLLAGLAASVFTALPRVNPLIRLLAIYGCGTVAAYSLVSYKTPWCTISIAWPFAFLFGWLVSRFRGAAFYGLAALALIAASGRAVWLNFYHYTDEDEPYVYVQTFEDINKLTGPLFEAVRRDPAHYHLRGSFIMTSFYPLPWVLGDFTHIGYYSEGKRPKVWDADVLLVERRFIIMTDARLHDSYFTDQLRLRGSQEEAKLYLKFEVFRDFFPNRQPEFLGD
jgi:uncharacterized protein (TIGR03663 family)